MRLSNGIIQAGAIGYILLWLLGIPIPILLLIFSAARLHIGILEASSLHRILGRRQ
jgi:hypothetical protein